MAVWDPEGEERPILQDLARPFFLVVFFFAFRSADQAKERPLVV